MGFSRQEYWSGLPTITNINPPISVITLNVNGLNASIKRKIVGVDQKSRLNSMLPTRIHFKYKDTYGLKVNGWRQIYHANTINKRQQE